MSLLSDIEAEIAALLADVEVSGEPVFAEAAGFSGNKRQAMEAVTRLRKPAVLVMLDERERTGADWPGAGSLRITLWLAGESLRGSGEARLGSAIIHGAYDLLGLAHAALDGALVATDHRLTFESESLVEADDRTVVFQQRYRCAPRAASATPTFGGAALAGAGGVVDVTIRETRADAGEFAFPGIDGLYRQHHGVRGRQIHWQGRLRTATSAELDALESAFESLLDDPSPRAMVDVHGRIFPDCVLDAFRRVGPRQRHPVTGQWLQTFEAQFTQLSP